MKTVLSAYAVVAALLSPVALADIVVKVTNDKGEPIAGAVVSFTPFAGDAAAPSPSLTPVVVNQRDLQFQPLVTTVPVGQTVRFTNEDEVLHHVFSFSKPKRFDLKLFGRDEPQDVTFDKPGVVAVGCNIHDNMIAYVNVIEAPFSGVSDLDGLVSLPDAPDAEGAVAVWHPLMRARGNAIELPITQADAGQVIPVSAKFRRGVQAGNAY